MDKRKNNGGHNTKAKGVDRRKNESKAIINEVVTDDKLREVLKMLLVKAIDEMDIQASKILLEYRLGKPKETKDITINEVQPLFFDNE